MTGSRHDTPALAAARQAQGQAAGQVPGQGAGQMAGQVFEPEELQVLAAAFQMSLETVAPPPWAERQPGADHYAKEAVAKVILGVARTGERDPEVIAAAAVDRLTI